MHSQIISRHTFIQKAGVEPQKIQRQIYLVQSKDLSIIFGLRPTDEKYTYHYISSNGSLAV